MICTRLLIVCSFYLVVSRRTFCCAFSVLLPATFISRRQSKAAVTQTRCEPRQRAIPLRLAGHDNTQEQTIYDAIIIGSGMSGLVAGNYLAQAGRKVLLLEKHAIPGGYTTNFYRKGYRFEVSTHLLNGCDTQGTIGSILREFGVDDRVDFVQLKSLLRWIDPAHNIDCVQPLGIEAYVNQLCELFPDQEAGIRRFHKRYYPVVEFVVNYEKLEGLGQLLYVLQNFPTLFRLLSLRGKTVADILDPLITDRRCKEMMTIMTALFGLHYSELDAAIFVMGSMMVHASGAFYPRGGSGKLSRVLSDQFTKFGGELFLNTHVDEIVLENGSIVGVRTTHKGNTRTDRARCVINSSDLTTFVNRLCPEGALPDSFVKSVRHKVPGNSLVLAWAGLDIDLRERGITDFEIIRSNNKSEQTKELMDHVMQTADYSELPVSGVTVYSNVDQSCCPPGKSVIATNFMANHDLFARALGSQGERTSPEYKKLKAQVKDQLLDHMKKALNMPDLADHIEVMEVATPITFQRYTDNARGSFMGWRNTPGQGAFSTVTPETPIKNLFICGQWLGVGGVASVMANGLEAGKMAEKYIRSPGGKNNANKSNYDDNAKQIFSTT